MGKSWSNSADPAKSALRESRARGNQSFREQRWREADHGARASRYGLPQWDVGKNAIPDREWIRVRTWHVRHERRPGDGAHGCRRAAGNENSGWKARVPV